MIKKYPKQSGISKKEFSAIEKAIKGNLTLI